MKKDFITLSTGLNKKTVVITRASSGAGRSAALEFAKYSSNLVLAARNETPIVKLI